MPKHGPPYIKNGLATVATFSSMSSTAHTHGASSPWVLPGETGLSSEAGCYQEEELIKQRTMLVNVVKNIHPRTSTKRRILETTLPIVTLPTQRIYWALQVTPVSFKFRYLESGMCQMGGTAYQQESGFVMSSRECLYHTLLHDDYSMEPMLWL